MRIEEEIKLDYSDVLFRPKRSTLKSRSEVDLKRKYKFKHSKLSWEGVPIIASNMLGAVELYPTGPHQAHEVTQDRHHDAFIPAVDAAVRGSGATWSKGRWQSSYKRKHHTPALVLRFSGALSLPPARLKVRLASWGQRKACELDCEHFGRHRRVRVYAQSRKAHNARAAPR